jgi:hypothetical protein
MIEVACTIAPLCGRDIFWIMWELPVAVAYQVFYFAIALNGNTLVCGPTEAELLERMRRCQKAP